MTTGGPLTVFGIRYCTYICLIVIWPGCAAPTAGVPGWLDIAGWPPTKKLPSSASSSGPPSDPAIAMLPMFRNSAETSATPGADARLRRDGCAMSPTGSSLRCNAGASKLAADLAVERPRPAAAQRDRERHQAPQQHVFVAAVEPREARAPVMIECEIAHLDRDRGSEKAGEQPGRDADAAHELDEGEKDRELDAETGAVARQEDGLLLRPAQHLAPAVDDQVPADRDADQRPGQRDDAVVEGLHERQERFRLGRGFQHDVSPSGFFSIVSLVTYAARTTAIDPHDHTLRDAAVSPYSMLPARPIVRSVRSQ